MAEFEANFTLNNEQNIDALFEIYASGTTWGNISGTLSNQEDLQEALDSKASNERVDGIVASIDNDIEEINTNISDLQTTVSDNYSELNTKIQNEAATRAENDNLLQGDINTLSDNLTAEISNRESADSGLQTQITNLTGTVSSNYSTLNNKIDSVESDLQGDIDTLENTVNTNTSNISTLNTTVSNLNTTVQSNYTILDTKINTTQTTLQGNIDTLSGTVTSNYNDLTQSITNNVSTLNTRITNEVSTLNGAISDEATARANADNNLQTQIDAITTSSDVFDIVGTYAELEAYDISTVPVNDIIKVLVDSTHNNAATYYRCVENAGVKSWTYIGSEGAYYTKGEADSTFVLQTRTINNKALNQNINLTASDVGALPVGTQIGNGTILLTQGGVQKGTFTLNQTSNATIDFDAVSEDITVDSELSTSSTNPVQNKVITTELNKKIEGINSSDVTTALGYTPYNASNPDGFIDDSAIANMVTIDTAQTITGEKTFSSPMTIETSNPNGRFVTKFNNMTIDTNPSAEYFAGFQTLDSQGTQFANVNCSYKLTGVIGSNFYVTNSRGYTGTLGVFIDKNGTAAYTQAPTPATNDNSTKIATTAYVKRQNYQSALVSGSNIKTINGQSILGSGNLELDGLPSQTGQSGKFLTTDGTDASWASVTMPTVDQTFDGTSANAQSGVAIEGAGFLKNTATGTNSLTLLGNTATNQDSINIGTNSTSMGNWNVTLGTGAYGGVMEAVAIGHGANYSSNRPGGGNHSVAIGSGSRASAGYSTAIGYGAIADNSYAIQLGYGTNNTASTLAIGFNGTNYQLLDGTTGKIPNARLNTLVGADGTNAGTAGIVPAPTATDNTKFLKGDGTWADLTIPTVDQTYDATSANAQSGVAIAGAGFVESSSLEEVQCVVETYQNGASWYRIWSDGWCEQGGVSPSGADQATVTVTLLKAFSNTNYTVASVQRDGPAGNYTNGIRVLNYTTSSFQINYRTGGTTTAYWVAYGYIEV